MSVAQGVEAVALANETAWRGLVNLDRLAGWMDVRGLGAGPIEDAVALQGGTQNVVLRFRRGADAFVLRRPPAKPIMDGDMTMRREARVLAALAGSGAPHPRLLAACDDPSVLGAGFYLMEAVDGFSPANVPLPAPHGDEPKMRHAMGLSVIDGLAAVGGVDYLAQGLEDFGRPEGFLERQVGRWMKQLQGYEAFHGWTGRAELPGVDAIAQWLEDNRPATFAPAIIHGDFHMANMMFSRTTPDLAAIVDWELSTIGDPLVDLGCLLATWADPDGSHPGCVSVTPWAGFPTESELVARYAERSGRDVSQVNWYVVLACFKLGLIQEGTYARAQAGQADMGIGRHLHQLTINLLERALRRI
ncbi:MAG: phosphotransferase family protein [Phenylobacterium sp.]|uniref:phosphotransferase family protein n=1 Tax=Phenylobacterium sp. TaxID=1871053 RepID=UPI002733958F|nr:phosphotransferase family protein [Phenylobacterium sp.]MDP3173823.1 phosphotransferase family protein [Phenylobacterium sp.]